MKKIIYILLLTVFILLIDDIFLGVDIHTYLPFHIWASPLFVTISYIVVLLSVSTISLYLLSSRKILAIPLLILYIVLWLFEINYKLIGGAGFNFNELLNIFHNPEFIVDAISSFISIEAIILSVVVVVFWLLIYRVINKIIFTKKISLKISFFLLFLLLIIDVFVYKKIHGFRHYPSNLKMLHSSFVQLFLSEPYSKREEPKNLTINKKNQLSENIIFIVDESIRGDLLQLNGYERETTPYLSKVQNEIINFGIAVSSTTQSHESNMIMRTGVSLESLPDINRVNEKNMPLVYYAKKAGFFTTILDSQSNGIVNGLREEDKKYVDKVVSHTELNCTKSYRDRKMIDEIVKVMDTNENNFIYFDKYGAHFHYDDTYPESEKKFSPTIKMEKVDATEREKRVNSYCNSIRWSVDNFWKILIDKLSDRDFIIVYVSDHGQSLMEDPDYKRTHAGNKVEQAIVPLWIYASSKAKQRLFKKYGQEFLNNKNRASHFEVFPTILKLLGVETNEISLFDKIQQDRDRYYFSPEGGVGRLMLIEKHKYIKRNHD